MYLLYAAAVAVALHVYYAVNAIKSYREHQAHNSLLKQHGCSPPPQLANQRPFGVDRLEQIFRADAESRLMELFLFHFRQTGHTLKQVFLGTPAYGTVDPANLEAILSSNFADWGNGPRRAVAFPMLGDGIFTQDGEAWRRSREILRPQLFHRQYEDLGVFEEPLGDLLGALLASGEKKRGGGGGRVVDLQPLFFRYTLDVTTAFLFGDSVRSLRGRRSRRASPENEEEEDDDDDGSDSDDGAGAGAGTEQRQHTFASDFDLAQKYVAKRFRLLDLHWLIGGREFRDACRRVHRFADQIIDQNLATGESEASGEGRYVFLKSVARSCPDREALRGQIVNILAAGRDTTACMLSWLFFHLVRHPRVLEKLRAEIAQLPPNKRLDRTALRDLKYLQNVMREILRLYPSLPVNTKTALRTTVLPTGGGPDRKSPVLIPKGTAVAYSVYTMHRRPDLYGMDAEIFRPERWDEEMPLNRDPTLQSWGYLPFNGGPRVCLGMDFAQTEVAYTVVRLLQRYPIIKLPEGERVDVVGAEKQTMTLVIQITDGCKVELG